jgi:glycosyltransferase involved in cell wall biosynthesis
MHRSCDEVISFARTRGKGAALRAGFAAALSTDCDVVLSLDADGQHDPLYAPALVAALEGADVVIGSRDVGASAMPIHRRMTNALSNVAVAACSGVRLPDTQSGYRAARAAVVREVLPTGDRYEFEIEFLLLAARRGFRFATVSVPSIYPQGGTSHFRLGRDAARIVCTFWRHRGGAAH